GTPLWTVGSGAQGGRRRGELGQLGEDVAHLLRPAVEGGEGPVLGLEHRGEGDLPPHDVHLRVGEDPPPLLHRADAGVRAVGDEGGALVHPLGVEHVEGVLQRSRHAVVVLCRDEDETVELIDLLAPPHGLGVLVLPVRGTGHRGLAKEVEVVVLEVHELVLGVVTTLRLLDDPLGDLLAETSGSGAPEDDRDLHMAPCVGVTGRGPPPRRRWRAPTAMVQVRGPSSRSRRSSTLPRALSTGPGSAWRPPSSGAGSSTRHPPSSVGTSGSFASAARTWSAWSSSAMLASSARTPASSWSRSASTRRRSASAASWSAWAARRSASAAARSASACAARASASEDAAAAWRSRTSRSCSAARARISSASSRSRSALLRLDPVAMATTSPMSSSTTMTATMIQIHWLSMEHSSFAEAAAGATAHPTVWRKGTPRVPG